jgi:hypothetical protein
MTATATVLTRGTRTPFTSVLRSTGLESRAMNTRQCFEVREAPHDPLVAALAPLRPPGPETCRVSAVLRLVRLAGAAAARGTAEGRTPRASGVCQAREARP